MRCDHCKHWGKDISEESNYHKLFRRCGGVKHEASVRDDLERDGLDWEMAMKRAEAEIKMSGAYVTDASDYWAALYTKADFFCALFEEEG